eukprot:TRINITY_DN4652_c0_g1_i1.p1 TRINITY_DN4652_c0_g1~~TRINITY_DN4652_c0_g1_i1.p1  ORF type:complete len:177 (-),score=25.68 TRINITY_DN4652_c0_g1_i1:12-542(-)
MTSPQSQPAKKRKLSNSMPHQTNPNNSYSWRELHADLEAQKFAGAYGADNTPYLGISEKKAGVDLREFHSKRTTDECYVEEFIKLLSNERTRKSWDRIVTFDPEGMTATCPTISGCKANLNIPEIQTAVQKKEIKIPASGGVINADGSVKVTKAAIQYAWNLPSLASRLNLEEKEA